MKSSWTIAAVAAFSTFASGVPFQKRAMKWITTTEVVMTTVDVVKTVWVEPAGAAGISAQADPTPAAKPKPSKLPKQKPTHAPLPAPTTAPSVPLVPKPTHSAAPKPSKPEPKPAPSSSSGGSSGPTSVGDGTYYDVGLGSCGWTSTPNEAVVALSYKVMDATAGANPNDNPTCGKMISITYKGVTQTAKVVDTCMGCEGPGDVDMSTSLFQKFASESVGRISGVEWHYIS